MDIDKSYQTKLIHYKEGGNGSVVPPIYQSSLFTFENWDSIDKAFDDPFNILYIQEEIIHPYH